MAQISGLLASGVRGISLRCAALSDCWDRQAGSRFPHMSGLLVELPSGVGDSLFRAAVGALGGITKRAGDLGCFVPVAQFPIGNH